MNQLHNASSTYLKSHAHNPVHWHTWNEEVLKKAQNENKIIIISIGYATCHWCHVMNKESFNDPIVANLMNENFINIKVDREERPDIDQVYMHAVHLINKRGGWPLNCFATPDGKPFYGGTYFPKESWIELLHHIQNLWLNEKHKILSQANQITNYVGELPSHFMQQKSFTDFSEAQEAIKEHILSDADNKFGGQKGAPKFLMPGHLNFLMDSFFFDKDPKTKEYIQLSLKKFNQGGIHDHLSGGFARYSVDKYWKVPHFEKTLYDNAQIVSLYTKAYKLCGNVEYKKIAERTANFAIRYLKNEQQLYYSGIDADSEGVEGKFYVWTKSEFHEILKENAHIFIDWFGIDAESLWENDLNVLTEWQDKQQFLQRHQLEEEHFDQMLIDAKSKLLLVREKRIHPVVDSNLIFAWNAMMIKALLEISEVSQNQKYEELALNGLEYLLNHIWYPNEKIFRTVRTNQPHGVEGFLEDYISFGELLLLAYLRSSDSKYLKILEGLVAKIEDDFSKSGEPLLNYTSKNEAPLFAQSVELFDNVIPSSNSMAAILFLKLGVITSSHQLIERAKRMANAGMYLSAASPLSTYHWATLFLMIQKEPISVKFSGFNNSEFPYHPYAFYFENKKILSQKRIEVCSTNSCLEPFSKLEDFIRFLHKK